MAILKPQHYRLLAGPYRTSVWAMLSRFKTELVAQAMLGFTREPALRQALAAEGYSAVKAVAEKFKVNRVVYRALLVQAIERLKPPGNSAGLQASELAHERCRQIESYLRDLEQRWEAFMHSPDLNHATPAMAQAVWAYYCVAYPQTPKGEQYNFCTWLPDSMLLPAPCFPTTTFGGALERTLSGGEGSHPLRLYPSLDACFEAGDRSSMHDLIDIASEHPLDFDDIERNLGHVQKLRDPHELFRVDERTIDRMLAPVQDPGDAAQIGRGLAESSSAFTDLFQFTNQAIRFVIHGREAGAPTRSVPKPLGVLFVASPALGALERLITLNTEGSGLQRAIQKAWAHAGGGEFTRVFHRDFQQLRERFRDFQQDARTLAAADVAHHSKSLLNNVTGLLRTAQSRRLQPVQRLHLLRSAEYLALHAGQEFGLLERARNVFKSQTMEMRDVLAGMDDAMLLAMFTAYVQFFLTIRQAIDARRGRHYSLGGVSIDVDDHPIDAVVEEITALLRAFYEGEGNRDQVAWIDKGREFGIERDPVSLTFFFLSRELVDNMRPRLQRAGRTELDVAVSLKHEDNRSGWRAMTLVQTLVGDCQENPFADAETAKSIERFNKRYGPKGSDLAELDCDPPVTVSVRQYRLQHRLYLPYEQGWHSDGTKTDLRRR